MADTKISALSAASALAGTEEIPGVQSAANVKITPDQIRDVVKAVAATSTDGVILETSTAATSGAQKWSPRIRWKGFGWKTDATAASQAVEFAAEVQPVQGAAAPTGDLVISSQVNAGGYGNSVKIGSDGSFLMAQGANANLASARFFFGTDRVSGSPIALNFFNNGMYMLSQGQQALLVSAIKIAMNSGQQLVWTNNGTNNDGTVDLACARKQTKVIEFNAGTAGTYAGSAFGNGTQTVAQLPAAAAGLQGFRAFVSDAATTHILGLGTTVTGGGANKVPVYCDGTNWIYG